MAWSLLMDFLASSFAIAGLALSAVSRSILLKWARFFKKGAEWSFKPARLHFAHGKQFF